MELAKKRAINFILAALVLFFLFAGVSSIIHKAPTADESAHHIPTGYVILTKGDFVFATDAPPLARMIGALPMMGMDIELPDDRAFWAREDRAEFAREFLYTLNISKVFNIFFFGRMMILLVGVFGGMYLFRWTTKAFGEQTGIIAAAIYFLSPNIMAHGRLVTTDMAATVFIMCSVLSFWDFVNTPDSKKTIMAALFLALALLSKFSALLLLPPFLVILIYSMFGKPSGEEAARVSVHHALLFLGSAFIFLWAGYGFELRPILEGAMRAGEKEAAFTGIAGQIPVLKEHVQAISSGLYNFPIPLRSFILGVLGVLKHGEEGARTFFMGSWSDRGHQLYYALAFLIKTPIPIILALAIGVWSVIRNSKFYEIGAYLFSVMILFFLAASIADLKLGLRYILPVYPLIFIFAAIGVNRLFSRAKIGKVLGCIMLLWLFASNIFIWPHYLSYFNPIIGGPESGHKYLRDSNLDWGQDLPALKDIMDKEGVEEIRLAYWGEADPKIYGISYARPDAAERKTPEEEVYAISINNLDSFEWAKGLAPDHRCGYSINVYDFRKNM